MGTTGRNYCTYDDYRLHVGEVGESIQVLKLLPNPDSITFAEIAPKLKSGRNFNPGISRYMIIQLPFGHPCGLSYSQTIHVFTHIDLKMKPFWEQQN